jgi:arylformamidase
MTTDTNPAVIPPLTQEQRTAIKRERTQAVRDRYQHELNLAYGNHPRQVVDIYHPVQTSPAPVLVFIHGGGFRNGAAGNEGYLGGPLLGKGAMYVSMGYRLLPDARYPESCDDIEHGLRWLRDHVAGHGGDPDRIYLSGTSAGATLAAAVALRDWVAEPGLPTDLIKGLVLFSGPYDRSQASEETDDHQAARFIPDLARAIQRVPPQTIVVSTDDDMVFAQPDADAMTTALRARGGSVVGLIQPGADHFNSPRSLADGGGAIFEAVLRMMKLS